LSSYVFPGYPVFLEAAAAELGHPESADPARRIAPLTALANLCAQASHGERAHLAGILAKAVEFRDQLATALRAAELMLASVEAGRAPSPSPVEADARIAAAPELPESRPVRKGPRTPRESS
jgi:hypothetical protein